MLSELSVESFLLRDTLIAGIDKIAIVVSTHSHDVVDFVKKCRESLAEVVLSCVHHLPVVIHLSSSGSSCDWVRLARSGPSSESISLFRVQGMNQNEISLLVLLSFWAGI